MHSLQQGLPLLRACRQIHHEASGVLYRSNTFIISRPDDPHTLWDVDLQIQRLEYALSWLSRLGSQQSRPTEVLIDASAMCHLNNSQVFVTFGLHLLRLIWKQPNLADALSFKHLNRKRPYNDPEATGLRLEPAVDDYDDAIDLKAVYLN